MLLANQKVTFVNILMWSFQRASKSPREIRRTDLTFPVNGLSWGDLSRAFSRSRGLLELLGIYAGRSESTVRVPLGRLVTVIGSKGVTNVRWFPRSYSLRSVRHKDDDERANCAWSDSVPCGSEILPKTVAQLSERYLARTSLPICTVKTDEN